MIKKSKAIAIALVACLLTCLFTFYIMTLGLGYKNATVIATSDGSTFSETDIALLNEVRARIKNNYYKDVDDQTLIDGAAKGMVESIGDDYSEFYTLKEYEDLIDSVSGEYYGIGVVISTDKESGNVVIVKVFDGSPAEKSGLLAGDMFLKVGDVDVTGMELDELTSLVKGAEGTSINVVVDRNGTEKTFSVTREKIEVDTVASKMLDNNIGYIIINQFASNTASEFSSQLNELIADGAKGIVIDERDNPGGLLDQVTAVADALLPRGTVVYTLDKKGTKTEYTSGEGYTDIPLVVLVNENSASASEILAGAIQDFGRGKIVGTTTYGKGIVQTMFTIITEFGSGLKLTTSTYYTPNGRSIQGLGITPDVVVQMSKELQDDPSKITLKNDTQLLKAIETLQEEIK